MNDDTISRAAALDFIDSMNWCDEISDEAFKKITIHLENLPPAQPEPEEFEWCHTCREYDQEKHCCHRWTKVIRKTVDDMKAAQPGWIPVTERLPQNGYWLWSANGGEVKKDFYWDGHWELAEKYGYEVLAWMPLPKPWEGDTDAH